MLCWALWQAEAGTPPDSCKTVQTARQSKLLNPGLPVGVLLGIACPAPLSARGSVMCCTSLQAPHKSINLLGNLTSLIDDRHAI